jgi:glycosyltransferase involved in cell wall biosynthesis
LAEPAAPHRIAFCGRLEHRKGPDVLVRAMPAILEQVPDATLALRGADTAEGSEGGYARALRGSIAELGVGHAVEVLDRWSPDAVREELRGAAVCAVPSRWESFGLVAAEASALGRPVVAAAIPGLADVVENGRTGSLFAPEDPDALAAAVVPLLRDPDLARRLGAAGAERVRARFDPAVVAAETLAAYERAIDVSRARARR